MRRGLALVISTIVCVLAGSSFASGEESLWRLVAEFPAGTDARAPWVRPAGGAKAQLDVPGFAKLLTGTPLEGAAAGRIVPLPLPDGSLSRFEVFESPVMAPALQAKFPDLRSYVGRGLDLPGASVRLDWTPRGLGAQILSPRGTIIIDPFVRDDPRYYTSFVASDYPARAWSCGEVDGPGTWNEGEGTTRSGTPRVGPTRRVYRLAVATTGEYTQLQGGTSQAMNAIVTLTSRLNGVYETEANIRFLLVPNDDLLIATDPGTDAYTNSDLNAMLGENQANIDAIIGGGNYDVGHVFGTANGGMASIGVACVAGWKAKGVSASPFAVTDPYTVQTFCHEVGHEFNARHTFNGVTAGCTTAQRSAGDAYEPGSGSTLMGYSSFCGADNINAGNVGDLYLNAQSFNRVSAWAAGTGACGVPESTGNNAPNVAADVSHSIPAHTPFELRATGDDPDGDSVTYCWEQRDLGPAQPLSAGDTGGGPLIRSRPPTASPVRSVPASEDVLAGVNAPGEPWPTTTRSLNFRVTARDNRAGAGGVSTDDVGIVVIGTAGPFRVTSPNSAVTWSEGPHSVTWDVAGTTASPISCASVRILLSRDGGATWGEELASGVPNSGSATVTIAPGGTTRARVRIEGVGNIFYDVSDTDFTIPCQAPEGVAASDDLCDRVHLSWTGVPGATGYSVWRSATNDAFASVLLGETAGSAYDDFGASQGSTSYYFVRTLTPSCTSGYSVGEPGHRAFLDDGVVGLWSSQGTQCASVHLEWTPYPGATSYQVRRADADNVFGSDLIATVTNASHDDLGLGTAQTHYYFVRALTSSCGYSQFSASASGFANEPPALAPTGVGASDSSACDGVHVAWTPSPGATSYDVLRNAIDDAPSASLVGSTAATAYLDESATPGVASFYFVRGVNACGAGPASTGDSGARARAAAFTLQPVDVSVCPGETAQFTVQADGTQPIAYQWYVGATPVGGDSPALLLPGVGWGDDGAGVRCEATNLCGTVSSSVATLDVRVCGPTIFVDASAPPGGDGRSWPMAFQELRDALALAASEPGITRIEVAQGVYRPTAGTDRHASFEVPAGVTIACGYPPGGGTMPDPRVHRVVLSGDLAQDDQPNFQSRADNSLCVLRGAGLGGVLTGATISGGHADGAAPDDAGAGVRVPAGASLTLIDAWIRDNDASGPGGGVSLAGQATITRCTLSANRAWGGGGLCIAGAGSLENTTISGNEASGAEGGGVLLLASGSVALVHCTIAGNVATTAGGGIANQGTGSNVSLSIVGANAAPAAADVAGDLGSSGWNLVQSADGLDGTVASDLVGVDPHLLALGDNGGPTPTHMPRPYSVAIDASPQPCSLQTDQRSIARPLPGYTGAMAACDLGAVEAPTAGAPCPADLDDGSGQGYRDGGVDVNDLTYFLTAYEEGDVRADLDDGSGAGVHDQGVDINDLLYFLTHYELGC